MTPAVVSLSGHFLAIDKIIPLNAERPRNLRRAFGTAPEEWPGLQTLLFVARPSSATVNS